MTASLTGQTTMEVLRHEQVDDVAGPSGLYDEDDVIVCLLSKSARSARQTEGVSKRKIERERRREESHTDELILLGLLGMRVCTNWF